MANDHYQQYKLKFTKQWARKISQRAGCAAGRGGRGKKDSPLQRLTDSLFVSYHTWQKWLAGTQAPSPAQMTIINRKAIELGHLGGVPGGWLKRMLDRAGLMSPAEFEFWVRYEDNPSFQIDDQNQELHEKAFKLEQQAAALLREARGIRCFLGQNA